MPRDARAYLADIIECCDAIAVSLHGLDLEGYRGNRLIRRATEREFTVIGEAVLALSRKAPEVFGAITNARRIVDFRNQLTHEYPTVSDVVVWAIASRDLPVLRADCVAMLERLGGGETI